MQYKNFVGRRESPNSKSESISLFFMSLVYPAYGGYAKRMELLINWANTKFNTVNFIVPIQNLSQIEEIDEKNLQMCNNLFLIEVGNSNSQKLKQARSILYRLVTGLFPPLDSTLFLDKNLIRGFQNAMKENPTDYFLNTRHNFAGLVSYVPQNTKCIIDTQDIFTEMHKKHGLAEKSIWQRPLLKGYREKQILYQTEVSVLAKYHAIIAISENDSVKYRQYDTLKTKTFKVEYSGIKQYQYPTAQCEAKEFDLLIVASDFHSTRKGINWLFNEVAPNLTHKVSLCIIGSICNYIKRAELSHEMIDIKLKGFVDNLESYYIKSRILTICMFEATGTSIKGMEALAFGSCIVSTLEGVRFGGVKSGKEAILTDDPLRFASKLVLLLSNPKERSELGNHAWHFYQERFNENIASNLLDRIYQSSMLKN